MDHVTEADLVLWLQSRRYGSLILQDACRPMTSSVFFSSIAKLDGATVADSIWRAHFSARNAHNPHARFRTPNIHPLAPFFVAVITFGPFGRQTARNLFLFRAWQMWDYYCSSLPTSRFGTYDVHSKQINPLAKADEVTKVGGDT